MDFNGFSAETLSVIGEGAGNNYEDALAFPIFMTSTFGFGSEFSYSRCDNPTRKALERAAAVLEKGKFGFAFSSGLAAVSALFSLFKSGDRIIISDDVYGGTYRLADRIFAKYGIIFDFLDLTDEKNYEKIRGAKLVFAESPTNPMMKIIPIAKIASVCREEHVLFAVDNTFLTPYYQNPLALGADIVLHSATKYLSGHHDATAGLLIVNDETLAEKLKLISNTVGSALSPFDSFLVLRGIKTLPLRMEKHSENAHQAAIFLKEHKNVKSVIYPALESHKGREICASQSRGFGGIVSFYVKNSFPAEKLFRGGKIIKFAESLGGARTLITYPFTQTHYSLPPERKRTLGITETLFRLSLGLENINDILGDLAEMLE